MILDRTCPIIACSSSQNGTSAIALIRLSGFKSFNDLKACFSKNLEKMKERSVELCYLLEPKSKEKIDHILVSKFIAPNSYTGENMLELSVHGNALNVQRILDLFLNYFSEMELADPGEFTYRAFKNQKLSLSQVEGLDLFLHAKTEGVLKESFKALHGDLHNEYAKLRDLFMDLKAALELNIDFAEDIGEDEGSELFKRRFQAFKNQVDSLSKRVSGDLEQLLSPQVVLLGQTNAGKSSLFNALVGQDRAIVTEIHGTTRDYVSEAFMIGTQSFRLYDTAGLRETEDVVEKEGIERTKKLSESAFFKILVINPFHEFDMENQLLRDCDGIILSHSDMPGFEEKLKEFQVVRDDVYTWSSKNGPIGPDFPLLKVISNSYEKIMADEPILVSRQRKLISELKFRFDEFSSLFEGGFEDFGVISSEMRTIGLQVEELIGVMCPDQVLGHIFSNFCIGK